MTTHTRKAIRIEDLKAKHFIAWLRKAVREGGRHTNVGYIGDHADRPLESWVKEVLGLGEYFGISSCDPFEVDGTEYYLSTEFQGFSICVLEGDTEREDWRGFHEINAWDMLKEALQYLNPEDYLVDWDREEPETNVETYVDYALDTMVVDMDTNGTFALVPSERDANITYRVDIDETVASDVHATNCRCDGHQLGNVHCKHMKIVDTFYVRIRSSDKTYADAAAEAFYAARGPEATANIAALKSNDAPCSLNGTRVPSETSKGATSIEASLGRRGLLR